MISFGQPSRRPRGEAIVPMINVVFLLLIFFLMTAQIAPPDPLDVTPPSAAATPVDPAPDTLYIDANGALAYEIHQNDAVFAALAMREPGPLTLRADAALPARDLARILPRLAAIGITDIALVTEAP